MKGKSEQLDAIYQWVSDDGFSSEEDYLINLQGMTIQLKQVSEGLLCIGRFNWENSKYFAFDIEKLLQLAGLSIGIFSAKLAIDPANDDVCLIYLIESGNEHAQFEQVLEELANQLDVWMQCLKYPKSSTQSLTLKPEMSCR